MTNKLSKMAYLPAALFFMAACEQLPSSGSESTQQSNADVTGDFNYIKDDGSTATDEEVAARLKYLVEVSDPRTAEDRLKDAEYRKKYQDAIVIDAVVIGTEGVVGHTPDHVAALAKRYKDGAYTAFGPTSSNGDEGRPRY